MADRLLYMAYGMNMNRDAMASRCPDARPLGGFYLPNHRLIFRGVADIVPDRECVVPVVLWEITPRCLAALDRLEGYPRLYDRRKINGWLVYDMNGPKTDISAPSPTYYRMIEEGYRDFDLDDWWLRAALSDAQVEVA